jgi:hypothetical protein
VVRQASTTKLVNKSSKPNCLVDITLLIASETFTTSRQSSTVLTTSSGNICKTFSNAR